MEHEKHNVTNVDSIDRRYIRESEREIPLEIKGRPDGVPMMEDLATMLIRHSGRTRMPDSESSSVAVENFPYLRSFENEVRDRMIHNTHGHKINSVLAARALTRQLLEIKDKREEEGRAPIMRAPERGEKEQEDSKDNDDGTNDDDSDNRQGQQDPGNSDKGKQDQDSSDNDDEDDDPWNDEEDEGAIDPGNDGGSPGDDGPEPDDEDFGNDPDDGDSGDNGGGSQPSDEDADSGEGGGGTESDTSDQDGDSQDSTKNQNEGGEPTNGGDPNSGGNSEIPSDDYSGRISEENTDYDPNGFDDFFDVSEIGDLMKSMDDTKEQIENLQNLSRAFSDLFGSGNIENHLSLSEILSIANRYNFLKKVTGYMGRFRSSSKKTSTSKGISSNMGAVVGFETGRDIPRVDPVQFTNKALFAKKYSDNALDQYKIRAKDPRDNGDFVLVIDESGSMEGERNEVAKAYAMNVLAEAAKKGRNCVLIRFGSEFIVEEFLKKEKRSSKIRKIIKFGMEFMYSGTEFNGWVSHIMHGIKNSKKMDVLILSDGSTYLDKKIGDEYRKWSKKNDVVTELILIHVHQQDEERYVNLYNGNPAREWGLTGIATNVCYIEPGCEDLEKAMNKHLRKL